jgi:hypothetical protein
LASSGGCGLCKSAICAANKSPVRISPGMKIGVKDDGIGQRSCGVKPLKHYVWLTFDEYVCITSFQ